MSPRFRARSLQEATEESPSLAPLLSLARDGHARLQAVLPLLPKEMHAQLKSGPANREEWCILTQSSTVAAKLRQLVPTMLERLSTTDLPIGSIRIKVLKRR